MKTIKKKCEYCGRVTKRHMVKSKEKASWTRSGYNFCSGLCSDNYADKFRVNRQRNHADIVPVCWTCATHDKMIYANCLRYSYFQASDWLDHPTLKIPICDVCGQRIKNIEKAFLEIPLEPWEELEAEKFRAHWAALEAAKKSRSTKAAQQLKKFKDAIMGKGVDN